MPHEDEPLPEPATRPQPYPLEEALEAAYAPEPFELPPHTDDLEDQSPHEASASASSAASSAEACAADSETGAGAEAGASVTAGPPQPLLVPHASVESVPESLHRRLEKLRKWQRNYVLALRDKGGVMALACLVCNVSRESVLKAINESSEFMDACHHACEHSNDLVEASLYKSATMGDLQGVYHRGVCIAYERKKSVKAATELLRIRGRGTEYPGSRGASRDQRGQPQVAQVDDTLVVEKVTTVVERLFSGRKGRPALPEPEA